MSDAAKGAGRGLLSITAAKLYFILTGFAVQVGLPRFLETDEFGLYSLTMSTVSVLNNVLIASTVQSVSKRVAEAPQAAGARLRQGLKIQLVVGVLLAGSLYLGAPWIGAYQSDDELGPLLRVAAAVPLCYALYAAFVGSLNGRRLFGKQAGLDASFATIRTAGILGAAAVGMGVHGSVAGFAGAACVILVVAVVFVGAGEEGEPLPLGTWVSFMLPVAAFQLALNATLLLDVQVLKRTISELLLAAGETDIATMANHYVGLHRAGQTFALVPYQVMLSVTFIVFPLVAQATAQGDEEATRSYIRNTLRFSMLALLAMAAPISGAADGVVRIAYPEKYWQGADVLQVLVFGHSALALFVIGATILNAAGRPWLSTLIGAVAALVVWFSNQALVRAAGLGEDTLSAAGLATSLGPWTALLLMGIAMFVRYRVFLPPLSVARGAIAALAGWWTANSVPHDSKLTALVAMTVGGLAYLAALAATGELGKRDLQQVLKALGKKDGPAK